MLGREKHHRPLPQITRVLFSLGLFSRLPYYLRASQLGSFDSAFGFDIGFVREQERKKVTEIVKPNEPNVGCQTL